MAYTIQYTWQAQAAIDSLTSPEREQVVRAIEQLRHGLGGKDAPPAYPIAGQEGVYVMRAGTDQRLRVVFSVESGEVISVRDVISQRLVRAYRKSVAG